MHPLAGAMYRLTGDDADELWGFARDASGLFVPDSSALHDTGVRRVEFLGCAPQGGLQRGIASVGTKRASVGNADLDFLDSAGVCMGSYFLNWITVERVRASALGQGLADVTVSLTCEALLPEAQWPWELVRSGLLVQNGMWRSLGPAARRAWLSVALRRHSYPPRVDDPSGARYELDGRDIVDRDSFYCAIGEAVNGPGGYFGCNLDALNDCMRGGFGATPPFTINWSESHTARTYLTELAPSGRATIFEVIMEICAERGVHVLLR